MSNRFLTLTLALGVAVTLFAANANAGTLSKEECVDAHSRGQDAREQGKLSLARKLFLTCAQGGCPAAVQGDCARFADDLTQQQPSMSFAARDAAGSDLPDTTVYVDDALIVTRLDDGKPHDADPGKHVVRFSNGGREQTVTVVLNTGEKGRAVVATFPSVGGAVAAVPGAKPLAPAAPPAPEVRHPLGAKVTMIVGAVALGGGAVVAILGRGKVPSNCSTSTNQCIGPPNDPSIQTASDAVHQGNLGMVTAGLGAAMVVGGLVWYVTGATTEHAPGLAAVPYATPDGVGVALTGTLW
jgi:hypothetical protein